MLFGHYGKKRWTLLYNIFLKTDIAYHKKKIKIYSIGLLKGNDFDSLSLYAENFFEFSHGIFLKTNGYYIFINILA